MARKLRPDEFEARNRQLPATVKRNLGGTSSGVRARKNLAETPLGSPPVDYDVRSVFDVRPVGGFDFNLIDTASSSEVAVTILDLEVAVPDGFVAVLRDFDIWFEPSPASILKSSFSWTLMLNGAEFPYNRQNFFGVAVDRELVFMLADEFNRIGLRVTAHGGAVLDGITAFARFHGTLILKTGRPLPFEIANPVSTKRTIAERPYSAPQTPKRTPPSEVIPTVIETPLITPGGGIASARPDFPVSWRAVNTPNGVQMIPMQNDKGQRRDLTQRELLTYATFLANTRPR